MKNDNRHRARNVHAFPLYKMLKKKAKKPLANDGGFSFFYSPRLNIIGLLHTI